jgi:hypothetical protein
MATYTWVADAGGDWTTTENWDTDDGSPTYPGSDDAAVFNSDHNGDCTVDESIEVGSVTDSGSYTGDLILSNQLFASGADGFSWTNGEISGAGTLKVARNCNIAGATISTEAAQVIHIEHDRSDADTLTADQTISNLTVERSTGGYEEYVLSGTFTISGDLTLNQIQLEGDATVTVQGDMTVNGDCRYNVNSADLTFNVEGDLNMTEGDVRGGLIVLDGDMNVNDNWDGGNATIQWDKAGNETWTPNPNVMYPKIQFNSARTVTLGGPLYAYDILVSAGATLDTDDETVRFQQFSVDNVDGTFTNGDSELHFSPTWANGIDCKLDGMTVNTLRVTDGYSGAADHDLQGDFSIGTLILDMSARMRAASGTPTVTGEFQILGGKFNYGTIDLEGDLTIDSGATDVGAGEINWTQAGDLEWNDTGSGTGVAPTIKFNSDRTVTLGDDLKAYRINLANGTLDVSSDNHSVTTTNEWIANTTDTDRPGFVPRAGTVTVGISGNSNYRGAADADGCPFYNLTMSGGAYYNTNKIYGYWNVENDLTISASGEIELQDSSIMTVGGNMVVDGQIGLDIHSGFAQDMAWYITGNLTMGGDTYWKTISGSHLDIHVEGNVDINDVGTTAGYAIGAQKIILDGSGDQTFDADATTEMPYLTIDKSSGTATITGGGTHIYDIDVDDGDLVFGDGQAYNFKTGYTVTVASGATLNFLGTDGSTITLREVDDSGDTWEIDNEEGSTVEAHYTDVKGSVATNPSVDATDNCTNSGGNVNWTFGAATGGGENIIDNSIVDPSSIDISIIHS